MFKFETLNVWQKAQQRSGRKSKKDAYNFYNITKGSAYEVVNVSMILMEKKLISNER